MAVRGWWVIGYSDILPGLNNRDKAKGTRGGHRDASAQETPRREGAHLDTQPSTRSNRFSILHGPKTVRRESMLWK